MRAHVFSTTGRHVLALCLLLAAWALPAAAADGDGARRTAPLRATLLLEHEQASPWNDLLLAGLERARRDFGMETAVVYAPSGTDQGAALRKAAEDSGLVLVASDGLHEALRNNAANFRRTMFGCIDAGVRAPNIMSVTFADEQASFLAGAAAALLTKAKLPGINAAATIGWLSGEDTPAMRSLFSGFAEGAQLAAPEVRVVQAVAGSFTDGETAAAKTSGLLDAGADVVALAAGAGNPQALARLRAAGAYLIGLDTDQGSLFPGHVLLSIVKRADNAVYEIAASAASQRFRGKEIVVYDLANGGVDAAGLAAFLAQAGKGAPESIGRRVGELRRELENGSIRLHSLRARTLCDCL
ncbi:BMP family ABC transporter substrate-binding protein [Desulfovibrio sp.]|uniref:BMP family lipoprotein n=1 Tax=Desulfovibrio sp. TaxID=885 RepID=UPI0023C11EBD|nr:BMP family ABC transporter substrate-binding protein [Desulfovibrio sp.]MDE7242071.1 BMP family ABC transporter substrate-binding protein [Desulfovibrio sp.]